MSPLEENELKPNALSALEVAPLAYFVASNVDDTRAFQNSATVFGRAALHFTTCSGKRTSGHNAAPNVGDADELPLRPLLSIDAQTSNLHIMLIHALRTDLVAHLQMQKSYAATQVGMAKRFAKLPSTNIPVVLSVLIKAASMCAKSNLLKVWFAPSRTPRVVQLPGVGETAAIVSLEFNEHHYNSVGNSLVQLQRSCLDLLQSLMKLLTIVNARFEKHQLTTASSASLANASATAATNEPLNLDGLPPSEGGRRAAARQRVTPLTLQTKSNAVSALFHWLLFRCIPPSSAASPAAADLFSMLERQRIGTVNAYMHQGTALSVLSLCGEMDILVSGLHNMRDISLVHSSQLYEEHLRWLMEVVSDKAAFNARCDILFFSSIGPRYIKQLVASLGLGLCAIKGVQRSQCLLNIGLLQPGLDPHQSSRLYSVAVALLAYVEGTGFVLVTQNDKVKLSSVPPLLETLPWRLQPHVTLLYLYRQCILDRYQVSDVPPCPSNWGGPVTTANVLMPICLALERGRMTFFGDRTFKPVIIDTLRYGVLDGPWFTYEPTVLGGYVAVAPDTLPKWTERLQFTFLPPWLRTLQDFRRLSAIVDGVQLKDNEQLFDRKSLHARHKSLMRQSEHYGTTTSMYQQASTLADYAPYIGLEGADAFPPVPGSVLAQQGLHRLSIPLPPTTQATKSLLQQAFTLLFGSLSSAAPLACPNILYQNMLQRLDLPAGSKGPFRFPTLLTLANFPCLYLLDTPMSCVCQCCKLRLHLSLDIDSSSVVKWNGDEDGSFRAFDYNYLPLPQHISSVNNLMNGTFGPLSFLHCQHSGICQVHPCVCSSSTFILLKDFVTFSQINPIVIDQIKKNSFL